MKRVSFIAILLVAFLVTACGGGVPPTPVPPTVAPTQPRPPTVPPTATVPPTPTQPPATATSANPLDALTRAFRGWGSVKSFRAKITTTTGTTANTDMALEVVMPDRFHMTSKQIEAIIIGTTYYLKTGNQWQKLQLPKGLDLSFVDVKKFETELGASTETKLIGPEILDGTPTLVYQYITTIKTPTPTTTTTKVWIGATDSLPRKMESVSKAGTKTTIIYSDYNSNIAIDPPIK